MKRQTIAFPALLAAMFSSAVFASPLPTVIDGNAVSHLERIGSVSVSGIQGGPDDAVQKLQQKAEKLGGSQLRIVALKTPGDSSLWLGNAEVYRQ